MRDTCLSNFYLSKIICKRPEVNSKPTHFLTFMSNDKAFFSLNDMACSYLCSEQLLLLLGHWQGKRNWISWYLGKPNLLENNPNNTRNNIKTSLKFKTNRTEEVLVCGITNTNIKQNISYQFLLILLENMNHCHKIISAHCAPLQLLRGFFPKTVFDE